MSPRAAAACVRGFLLPALLLACAPLWAGDGRLVILLGETDGYIAAAGRYWSSRLSPQHIVHGVGSLAELRQVLATHPRRGDAPWREIILVSHASEWSGLPLPLHPAEDDATPGALIEARKSGSFPALRPSILDEHTRIRLEGCGVGRRSDVLEALAHLFAADGSVRISASPHLIAYLEDGAGVVRRAELAYVTRTVRHLHTAEAAMDELASELTAVLDNAAPVLLRREQRPVGVRLPLPQAVALSGQRPERIANRYQPLRRRLDELGFRPGQMHWSIESDSSGSGTELVGQAYILIVSQDPGLSDDAREAP